jgi:hypothetical protein
MSKKYSDLDTKIVSIVGDGGKKFHEIISALRQSMAIDERMVDRRLAYLRKQGKLRYQKGDSYGWYPVKETQRAAG